MPKYKVTMNLVEAKRAEFVVEAKDPYELRELLDEVDMDFIEENAGFYTIDFEPPMIEEYEKVNKDTPVHKAIQKEMNLVKQAWEAL